LHPCALLGRNIGSCVVALGARRCAGSLVLAALACLAGRASRGLSPLLLLLLLLCSSPIFLSRCSASLIALIALVRLCSILALRSIPVVTAAGIALRCIPV